MNRRIVGRERPDTTSFLWRVFAPLPWITRLARGAKPLAGTTRPRAFAPYKTLVAALLIFAGAARAADQAEIRVGSELNFRPYAFTDKEGQVTGFSTDLIKAVADAMGLRLRITTGPWDKVWDGLVAGQFDMLPTVARTPGREPLVDFSLPHTQTFDAFFVRPNTTPIRSLIAATGKEIVVLREDAAHHQLVERKFTGTIIPVESIPEGLRLIAAGKHDAFLCSILVATLEMKQAGIGGVVAGPPIPDYKRTFSFAVRKGNAELLEKLNQGLLIVKSDGTYERIYQRWLTVEDPWRKWQPYFKWVVVGLIWLAGVVAVLQWLVRQRTRDLARANEEIAAEVAERRNAQDALQQLNVTLEQRVTERTAELQQARKAALNLMQDAVAAHAQAERITSTLRESEQRIQQALSVSHSFTFEWDPATDKVQRSASCGPILGLTGDEAVNGAGQNYFQCIHPDDRARFTQMLRALTPGNAIYTVEYRVMRDDGTVVMLEEIGQASFAPDSQLDRLVGVTTDITARKQAEEALQASEAKYRNLFTNMTEEVHFWQLVRDAQGQIQTWRLVDANPPTLKSWGRPSVADICGKTTDEIFGPGATEHYRPVVEQIFREGRPHSFEDYFPNLDKHFRFTSVPLGEYFITTGADITEIKKTQLALRASEEQLRLAMDAAEQGAWEIDLVSEAVTVSPRVAEIFGADATHQLQTRADWRGFVVADDRPLIQQAIEAAVQGDGNFRVEFRVRRPATGDICWVRSEGRLSNDATGRATRLVGVIRDITERKLAMAELARTHALLDTLLTQAPVGFAYFDRELRYVLINDQLAAINGLSVAAHRGRHVGDILPALLPAVQAVTEKILATGQPVKDHEFSGETAAQPGVTRYWNESWYPVRDSAGAILGFGVVIEDITERKQAEARLEYLASIPERNPNPIMEVDLDGSVRYANPAARRLFPDAPERERMHPYLADWATAVHPFVRRETERIAREVIVGEGTYEQVLHYFPDGGFVRIYGFDITERKQAEAALRRSREDLDRAQQVGQIGSWRLDTRQNVLTWSDENHRIFGIPEGTPLSYETFLNAIHPDDRQFVDRQWQAALRGEPYDIDHRIVVAGQVKWVREKAYLNFDEDGQLVGGFGITQDITERKRAEEKLWRLNRTLGAHTDSDRALIHSTDEASYLREVCRIITADCGHVMVWVGFAENDDAKTVRPAASDGFEAGYLDTLQITWADTERGRGPTGTAIRTGQVCQCRNMQTDPQFAPWRAEAIRRGFGSSAAFPLLADGKAFGALTIYTKEPDGFDEEEVKLLAALAGDFAYGITTLRLRQAHAEAEEALRQSEAQFRLLFEANPNPMWVFDEETLRFLAVNHAAVRHYGYSLEEFLALTIFDIRPPEERDRVQASVAQQVGVHNANVGIFRHCQKDGTVIAVEIVASSIPFAGRPGRLVLATDVTDRLRAERVLQEAHDLLEQRVQERTAQLKHELAERRRLENAIQKVAEAEQRQLGSALHDGVGQYMAALNLLTGALEQRLIKRRSVEVPAVRKIRRRLEETFQLTRQLARGLYAADVDREGLPTALDLLAGDITKLFQVPCEYRQEQLFPLTDSEVSRQLYRIAQEAATNAAKHAGGKRIIIELAVTDGQLALTVADNGHGLQTPRDGKPGMGLAIMKYRAQSIGATLVIRPRPQGGTEVICSLPLPAAPPSLGTKP